MRLLAAAIVAVALTACGTATTTVTKTSAGATQTITQPGTTQTESTQADTVTEGDTGGTGTSGDGGSIPTVPVGKGQPLSADQENTTIDMTVTKVQDLAGDEFSTPDPGKHYVGVYLKYHNTGSASFNDAPDNEVTIITNKDNSLSSDVADLGDCSNDGNLTVGAGETINSCVTFQEPNDQKAKIIQVALDSGNDSPGQWTLH